MKHISDLTNQPTHPQSEKHSRTEYTDEAKRNIQEIFLLMKANYGHKWTSNLKTTDEIKLAARLWLHHFHRHDRDTLHRALELCFLRYDWPPTIKNYQEQLNLIAKERHVLDSLALPAPVRKPGLSKVGIEALAELKAMMGK